MGLAIGLLILALIFFGVGFAVKVLWYVAIVVLVIAIISYIMGRGRV